MVIAFGYYLLSFLASLINPFWGLIGFVCSLLLRFQDHYPQLAIIKPFTLLLAGMLLSCLIHKDKLSKVSWAQDKLILYILGISITGLLIMSPSSIIGETYQFLCSLALYFFASRILQTPQQIVTLFFFMALSVSYLAYLAIMDIGQFPQTTEYIDHATKRWQGIGYYANSNEFGQLMITTTPFLIACFLASKSNIIKLISAGLMAIMLFVMHKCASRTVMVTFALMVIGTFMLRGSGNIIKKAVVGGTMAVLMLTVLTFLPGPIQERMSTVLDAGNDESFQGRTRAWTYGFDMISWYPITGVGKGQWLEYHGLMPHNTYVQIMAELGIFGIFIFLWILKVSYSEFSIILANQDKTGPPDNSSDDLFSTPSSNESVENSIFQSDQTGFMEFEADINFSADNTAEESTAEESIEVDNYSKTMAIAVFITFSAWLFYIFLGNQGYSVWTYFYIGLCAAVRNYLPHDEEKTSEEIFEESER